MQRTLALFLFLSSAAIGSAQVTLFTEDFEGPSPAFTLNTTDAGSGISAWNTWVINNSYTGGTGSVTCLGFPFTYTIVNTPGQPVGISSANGKYLHTASVEGIADGITCCSFGAADGFCIPADNTFSRMTSDVSTAGYADVDLSFWWLCEGAGNIYGQVYYSTNGGGSWNLISTPITNYNNQGSWVQQTISDPAFGNQATLRFGFKFVNAVSLTALDPGFGIDDVAIVAQTGTANAIACSVPQLAYCGGDPINVTCTATGTFNAGNLFTAELSDALGSFTAPVSIGSVLATTSTVFAGTIPPGTAAGSGYRVRVVSTDPPVIGTSSATFTIAEPPNAGTGASVTECTGATLDLAAVLTGTPDPGGVWSPAGPLITVTGSQIYTYQVINACGSDSTLVLLTATPAASAGVDSAVAFCEATGTYPLFSFLGGSPDAGGSWTDPGGAPYGGVFNSSTHPAGAYTYVVGAIGGCGPDTAVVNVSLSGPANAGNGGSGTLCSSAPPTSMISLLTGSPDVTGTWIDPLGSLTNATFDQGIDPPGTYTYVVDPADPCPNDSAFLTIAVQQAPDAGTGGTVTVCDDDPALDLFTQLGGTPDVGGSWTGPGGGAVSNLFDPATDPAGLYIYTVDGAPACPDADAALAMVIDPCNGIAEVDGASIQWLGQDAAGAHHFALDRPEAVGITLHDALGRALQVRPVRAGDRLSLDLGERPRGVYFVTFTTPAYARTIRIAHAP